MRVEEVERELSAVQERLAEMSDGHKAALQHAVNRADELKEEADERDALLKETQRALERASQQLEGTTKDSDGKLKAAVEVAASLRSMLSQRDAALKSGNGRERRQAEALRQLEAKNKGLQAQLAQMKEAEGKALGGLGACRSRVGGAFGEAAQ